MIIIDELKEKYKGVFAFKIQYSERHRLDIVKEDVNSWILNIL